MTFRARCTTVETPHPASATMRSSAAALPRPIPMLCDSLLRPLCRSQDAVFMRCVAMAATAMASACRGPTNHD